MSIASLDPRRDDPGGITFGPHEDISMTPEQFRTALKRSAAARQHVGLDLSDRAAAVIAADEALSASSYARWRLSARIAPDQTFRIAHEHLGSFTAEESEADWQRKLPMRFNPPPGWAMPGHDWILQHIGLDMADEWRPPGAPTDDPVGWLWWIPQDPAWSTWTEKGRRSDRMGAFWAAGLFAVSLMFGVAGLDNLMFGVAGLGNAVAFVPAAMALYAPAGVGISTFVLHRHARRDPMAAFRDRHVDALGTA